MSQEIQFYKITIFSDQFLSEFNGETNPFSTENMYECVQGLFKGYETKSSEYVAKYFENLELDYLSIYVSELEKIDIDFNKAPKYIFDGKTEPMSLVDEKLWSNLETIIHNKIKESVNNENVKKSLKDSSKIVNDYQKLLDLFQKRVLFRVIF